jgi:hypothetical protein
MFNQKLGFKILTWFENALFLQAICTLVSTPILYSWKMPNSYCSTFGNLLFAPFMSGFILLSALIFCCSLCNFYPQLLFFVFQKMVNLWLWLLKLGSPSWLFIPNSITMLCWLAGSIGVFWLYHTDRLASTIRRSLIVWLCCFSIASIAQSYTAMPNSVSIHHLYKNRNKITVMTNGNGLAIVDSGIFGRLENPEKFIIYQLKPFLLEHFNSLKISSITLPQRSKRYLNAALKCRSLLRCRNIYWKKN